MTARDLLFELGTEELPPRTLLTLSTALTDGMLKGLEAAGVLHGKAHGFATPRRLAVTVAACAEFAQVRRVERRGPPVAASFDAQGAPTQAAAAFAKSCGVDVGNLERLTTDKGAWLAYRAIEPGAATADLLRGIVTQAIAGLPIAKRMRWGAHSAEFVRPVRSVILLFGDDVVPVTVLGLHSGRITTGHRFHAPRPLTVKSPKGYESQLRRGRVIADFAKRRAAIRASRGMAGSHRRPLRAALSRAPPGSGDRHRAGPPAVFPGRRPRWRLDRRLHHREQHSKPGSRQGARGE